MNDLVTRYRAALAAQGVDDPRDDYVITQELGDAAQRDNPALFDQFPDFAKQWGEIRDANAPSLPSEFGRAARAGVKGLGATALGGLSLLTGSDYLRDKAKALDDSASTDAPTIGTLEDIAPGQSTKDKILSRDAVRYSLSKLGSAIPSIGEAVALSAGGALAGSAIEPGVGTVAGAAEGAIEGILGRGVIKNAIRSLLAKGEGEGAASIAEIMAKRGLLTDVSEAGISSAIRNGSQEVADIVSQQARQIAARRAGIGANTLNSYLLSSGEIYNETGDRGISAGLGAIAAIPDTILPSLVIGKLFPNLTGKAATEEAKATIAGTVAKVGKKLGLEAAAVGGEGATEWFQEGVDIVARNLKEGKPADTFTPDDLKRMREAGIAGAAGGLVGGIGLLGEHGKEAEIADKKVAPASIAPVVGVPPSALVAQPGSPLAQPGALIAQPEALGQSVELEVPAIANQPPAIAAPIPESSLLGKRVSYNGESGVLRRDEHGTLVVEGPNRIIEVENAGKETAPNLAQLGIAEYRPVSFDGGSIIVNGQSYTAPADATTAINVDRSGNLVSVSLTNADGEKRTIRDPEIAWSVANRLAEQHYVDQRGTDTAPVTAVELAGDNSVSRWIDSWTKSFVPQTVEISDLLDLGESRMPDGSSVSSRDEYWALQKPIESRTISAAKTNIENQISRVEQSTLPDHTKTDLTDELYELLQRIEGFEKQRAIRSPAPIAQTFPESAVPAGAPQGSLETQAVAPPQIQVTISQPQTHPATGGKIPGYVQFDRMVNDGRGEPMTAAERAELPSPEEIIASGLPTGQYTLEQVKEALAAKPAQLMDVAATIPESEPALVAPAESLSGGNPPSLAAPQTITPPALEAAPISVAGKSVAVDQIPVIEPKLAPAPVISEQVTPFEPGAVIQGSPSIDFRIDERFKSLSPEQWRDALKANIDMGVLSDGSHNRAITRIAVALEAPDGRVIKTGLILPDRTLSSAGVNAIKEPALQRMGLTRGGKRIVEAGGNQPATVADVVRAGYKPIAVIHFEGHPTKIYRSYSGPKAFDQAWAATPNGTGSSPMATTTGMSADIARTREQQLQERIDSLGSQWLATKSAAEREELSTQIKDLYNQLDSAATREQQQTGSNEIPEYRRAQQASTAVRSSEFQAVLGNLRNLGARVDVFAKEFMAQGIRTTIKQKIAAVHQAAAQAQTPAQRNELERQLGVLNERLDAVDQAAGVTYSPYHIAVSTDDIRVASLDNLVTLLHEAAESLTQRLTTVQRGDVLRAVDKTMDTLASRGREAASKTGARVAETVNAADALSESLAQQLAAAGIPESSSLADSIVRWVKDLYYRAAMAVQRAFGAEPSEEMSLAWFENQLRREVSGDYDYRLANLIDRFLPEPVVAKTQKFVGHDGTPGNITDFRDPISGLMTNPTVDPLTSDALAWNIAFRSDAPGSDLDIPDPEARARQQGAAINEGLKYATDLHKQIGQGLPFDQFLRQMWPGTDPRSLLQDLEQQFPGAGAAQIGGERMTQVMDQQALRWVRSMVNKVEQRAIRMQERLTQEVATQSDSLAEAARETNRLEGDLRNASLHGDVLRDKARTMSRELVRAYSRGLDTAHTHGELAEAIRQAEELSEADPIPEQYQRLLKRISDGEVQLFDYVKAIARLDLPIGDLSVREILNAIDANADSNETLRQLADNRPLAVTLATLAKKNEAQVDQIQLGWMADTERFRKIHEKLEEIRRASPQQLKQLMAAVDEKATAKGLEARIKTDYLRKRRELQRTNDRLQKADDRLGLFERSRAPLRELVGEVQRRGGGSYSDWQPRHGAQFTSMQLQEDGSYKRTDRTLEFKPDGSAVNSDQVRSDIAQNRRWLEENADKAGEKFYEQVKRETLQLAHLDVQRQYPAGWQAYGLRAVDKWVRTPISAIKDLGGAASARIAQRFQQFQFIQRTFAPQLEGPSNLWSDAQNRVMKAAGISDVGVFLEQIYDPVSYFLNSNPGLDEPAAIRKATAMARKLVPGEPAADFNEQFGAFLRRTKELSEKVAKIAEQYGVYIKDPRLQNELRRALPTGWLTSMRSLKGSLVQTITQDMQKAGWKLEYREQKNAKGEADRIPARGTTFDSIDPVNAKNPDERAAYMQGLLNDAGIRPVLAQLFTPQIIQRWLEPFINKPGVEPFSYDNRPIPQLDVQDAWARANGDVLTFIDNLQGAVNVAPGENGEDPRALFRLSMLRQFDSLFGMESKLAYTSSQSRDLFDPMGPRPNALMEARLNELIPPEHLSFQSFDPQATHRLLGVLAFTGAFGRNGEALISDFREIRNHLQGAKADFDALRGTTDGARAADAAAKGLDYRELEKAAKRYDDAKEIQNQVQATLGVGNPAGPFHDMRGGMAALSGMAGQIVDNPKTGAYNLLSIAMRPFAMKSLGPMAMGDTVKAYGDFLKTGTGSLLEAMGLHLMHASEYAKDVAASEGQIYRELPYGVILADQGNRGKFQTSKTDRWLIKPINMLRAIQRKGVKLGIPTDNNEFPRLAPIPGLGVLNTISQIAAQGGATNLVQRLEKLVVSGVNHFAANPADASNPAFRFTAKDLGIGKLDAGVLDWFRGKTVEYGLGNLEDLAREAAPRQARAERILTRDQAIRVAQMNANELDGAASINTTPLMLQTNPVLRSLMPLLRWPLWMMSTAHEGLRTAEGRANFKSAVKGLGTLALWNLPIGLAFSFLMDEYDDKLLGKKANSRGIDKMAAVPLIGPELALLFGDKTAGQNLLAFMERGAKAGNVYGLGADLLGQFVQPYDPNSGQRQFSLDQRVLAMSQFLNLQQSFRNLVSTGGVDTWANFWKPFLQSVGGNGVLHSLDITNQLLGLDNQESRLVSRINASNWLRSAGRELDIPLSTGGGSQAPTALGAYTREMYLAASANDRLGFQENFRLALNTAKDAVAEDPNVKPQDRDREALNRVLASWRSRDPRSVFAQKPTDVQFRQILSVMDDDGQADVTEAISRYNNYTSMIAPTKFERTQQTSMRRSMTPTQARGQMSLSTR